VCHNPTCPHFMISLYQKKSFGFKRLVSVILKGFLYYRFLAVIKGMHNDQAQLQRAA
jgi:hypothetical protein